MTIDWSEAVRILNGGKQRLVRCPECGELKGNLPNHLPSCVEKSENNEKKERHSKASMGKGGAD